MVAAPFGAEGDEWQTLFDGWDLSGWRATNDPESFAVVDSILRVQASGPTSAHLFYVGDKQDGFETFEDFELEAVIMAEPNSNGEFFVHTDATTRDAQKHLATGYEVQLNSSSKEKRKTGSLHAVVDLGQSPVDETQWFTVRVVVQGKRITGCVGRQRCGGLHRAARRGAPSRMGGTAIFSQGRAIAIQADDSGNVWYFRSLRIKRLP